jgi:AcrR family transcriptional regulator
MNQDTSSENAVARTPEPDDRSAADVLAVPVSASADTKTRILDAAERLFARQGFNSISLRQITSEAGVNLAAVNYHFRSKDSLIEAVIGRLIEPINQRRIALLEKAEAKGQATPEEIVRAFVVPVFESDEIRHIRPILGHVFGFPHEFLRHVFDRHLADVALRFRLAIQKSLPHLTPEEVAWRFVFLVGAVVHVMAWADILPQVSGGLCDPADTKSLTEQYLQFITAGLSAPGGSRS